MAGDEGKVGRIEWWGKRLILSFYFPLFCFFLWNYSAELAHRQEAEARASHYAERGEQRISSVCLRRETSRLVADCVAETADATRESQRREREVQAQQETASYTWAAAFVAFLALGTSIGGIWVLWRAIKDGQKEFAHAQQTADAELRPWLKIEAEVHSFSTTDKWLSASFTAIITNIGRTPAQNVRIGYTLLFEGKEAMKECREMFGYPGVVFSYAEQPRALLPTGNFTISRRARMPKHDAESRANWLDGEGIIPNPILLVIGYYDCPSHDDPSKTAISLILYRRITLPGPEGPRRAPGRFTLTDSRISTEDIRTFDFGFCEAT